MGIRITIRKTLLSSCVNAGSVYLSDFFFLLLKKGVEIDIIYNNRFCEITNKVAIMRNVTLTTLVDFLYNQENSKYCI